MNKKPSYITDLGGYNSLPKPYKRISQNEFIETLTHCNMLNTENRQIIDEDKGWNGKDAKIFWCYSLAMAVVCISWGAEGVYEYYRIGCRHARQFEENIGNCYNKITCLDCGYERILDSSD